MSRLRFLLVGVVIALLLAVLVPAGLWVSSGQPAWLLLVPVLLLLLLLGMVQLGLWGSRGNLPALLRGQADPGPKRLVRDITIREERRLPAFAARVTVDLDRPVSEVSDRYLSFSVDTSQVVGGKWWNPQAEEVEWSSGTVDAPVFDFDRPRLNLLTKALGPAYVRIGGSEADKVYFDRRAGPDATPVPPDGYESVMTRAHWDAVHAFADRNGLKVVCTLNAGPAARNAAGRWRGENAAELLAYTAEEGYPVAVWELGNELNTFFAVHGPAAQIPVEQYAEDLKIARELVEQYTPGARLAGQGSAFWPVLGEPLGVLFGYLPGYLARAGDLIDVLSWHYYPQQSRRGPIASRRAYPSRMLDSSNLDEAGHWAAKINRWRDRYAPGKPVWLGETGNAQFGGEPGVSDVYLGGLWWLDQLGLLAHQGHRVTIRQSLTGMDYGLLDEETLDPRPDYWNSLLWKRLMGGRVYGAKVTGEGVERLRVYAHALACHGVAPGESGSVAILALNLDPEREATVSFPEFTGRPYEVYAISTPDILGRCVMVNGVELKLVSDQALPEIWGIWHEGAGVPSVKVRPLSYLFVTFPPG